MELSVVNADRIALWFDSQVNNVAAYCSACDAVSSGHGSRHWCYLFALGFLDA